MRLIAAGMVMTPPSRTIVDRVFECVCVDVGRWVEERGCVCADSLTPPRIPSSIYVQSRPHLRMERKLRQGC